MANGTETSRPYPERTAAACQRDPYHDHLGIRVLREEAMPSGEAFRVANLALDAADPGELWDGLTGSTATSGRTRSSASS